MTVTESSERARGHAADFLRRIETREAVVGVIGLGYIGLPATEAMVEGGFPVIGFDVDVSKVERLNRGESYLSHLGADLAERLRATNRFEASADMARLAEADAVIVCVPTPLGPGDRPDLSYVTRTMESVAAVLRPGQLVVLKSTTYPRTTRDVVLPILQASGLVVDTRGVLRGHEGGDVVQA